MTSKYLAFLIKLFFLLRLVSTSSVRDIMRMLGTCKNIQIKKQIGVLFDSKLNWTQQEAKTIIEEMTSLHAIKSIRKYFTTPELKQLITSNFYSILYYS